MAILSSFIEGFKEGRKKLAEEQAAKQAPAQKDSKTTKSPIFEVKVNKEAIQERIQKLEASISAALKKLEAKFDEDVVDVEVAETPQPTDEAALKRIAELEALLAELKSKMTSKSV